MCKKLIYLVSFVLVLGLAAGVANADIQTGLVGYWPLDEGAGDTTADMSGNGHNGTLHNGATWVSPGFIGNAAVNIDGKAGSRVAVGTWDPGEQLTLAIWARWTGEQNSPRTGIIGKRDDWTLEGLRWFSEVVTATGEVRMRNYTQTVSSPAGALTAAEWAHVGITFDGTTVRIYLNAKEVGSGPFSLGPHKTSGMGLGCKSGGSNSNLEIFSGDLDDARIYNRALSVSEIKQLFEWTGKPRKAYGPEPADGQTDVPRDVSLIWKPGIYADKHDAYFGTVFNDVNDADRTNPLGVLVSQNQVPNSYSPAEVLQWEQTYYWRVDEVNAPPDFTIFKGGVWQFTVEPFAYPIAGGNIIATASSQFNANTKPENTINGSGLNVNDLHSTDETGVWLSSMTGAQPTWIRYEFDKVYKLYQMWVWNFNQVIDPVVGFGFKDVTIEYSTNGTDWAVLAGVPQFTRAPGTPGYTHNTTIDLSSVVAKYVKITANSNWGGILPQYGLSEVRFFYVPVIAREPDPASGATDVPVGAIGALADVTLSFRAGREAAKHNVYFSDSPQGVIDGTAPVTTVTQARYGPLSLDLGKSYYWKVNEVNEAETPAIWQGGVWNFSTQGYFVVDDFEDYNDFEPDRIFDTWIDGWADPANGSQVGYATPPFAEKTIVHGGKQSMPFSYNNTAGVAYSEAERTFATPLDWTVRGVKTLTLWFRGNPVAFLESPPGTFTMSADGVDIWDTSDQFRYAYKQLTGNGEIIATVESVLWVTGSNDWSKGGVMIRETLDPGARNAFVAITTGAGNGATFQWRPSKGGSSSSSRTLTGIAPPAAVKLVRQGNVFTGYVFLNGQWQQEGTSATVTMVDPVYIGLALTSHSTGVTTVARFSNVSTTGAVTGAWQVAEIGVAQPSNTAAPLYVALADSANKTATVKHSDPAATNIGTWTEWNIELAQFTGVNPRAIKKMIVGVGDKANPQPGTGSLYFDDIRLYPQR